MRHPLVQEVIRAYEAIDAAQGGEKAADASAQACGRARRGAGAARAGPNEERAPARLRLPVVRRRPVYAGALPCDDPSLSTRREAATDGPRARRRLRQPVASCARRPPRLAPARGRAASRISVAAGCVISPGLFAQPIPYLTTTTSAAVPGHSATASRPARDYEILDEETHRSGARRRRRGPRPSTTSTPARSEGAPAIKRRLRGMRGALEPARRGSPAPASPSGAQSARRPTLGSAAAAAPLRAAAGRAADCARGCPLEAEDFQACRGALLRGGAARGWWRCITGADARDRWSSRTPARSSRRPPTASPSCAAAPAGSVSERDALRRERLRDLDVREARPELERLRPSPAATCSRDSPAVLRRAVLRWPSAGARRTSPSTSPRRTRREARRPRR